jgi:hypothetical protein
MDLKHASLAMVALAGIGLGVLTTPTMAATCNTNSSGQLTGFTTATDCLVDLDGGPGGGLNINNANNLNKNAAFGQTNWTVVDRIGSYSAGGATSPNSIFTFTSTNGRNAGDWALSPTFKFEAGKIYAFALKGGNGNAVYLIDTNSTSGIWTKIDLAGGLSNVTLLEAAVPLPAAAWLFGSALLGLAGIGYRRKRVKVG